MVPEFRNEPLVDFDVDANRRAFEAALRKVDDEATREWPLVIGGESVTTGEWIKVHDPSEPARLVGRVARAGRREAERAVEAARRAWPSWAALPAEERAAVLLRAAALMRRRRHELSAQMVVEIGKSWVEADADTAEAIDFCEFYARESRRLAGPQPIVTSDGSDVAMTYQPLGVGVAISPWNFPCAIATGMTVGPVVAGNCVLFKPASLTPIVAARMVEILEEAGLPPGVVNFVPGSGEEVGDFVVEHPEVRFVSFTGSREVGTRIYERAARVQPGQRWLKRVVAEMGGKDAIVVDDSWCDLEAAASGIVVSAYGFQGQKCSACSRMIAVGGTHDRLVELVVEGARALRIGSPRDPTVNFGPLASADQLRKVQSYVELGEGRPALMPGNVDLPGYFYPPTVIDDVPSSARIAQEEIFGPVLSVLRARDYDEAIAIANSTPYGLTGSVYALDRTKLERAKRDFQVGNLYLNRKCTGARVGVEPFGGFGMSGTNAKAGGPDYLKWFVDAKVSSELL
ncbi:MAG TPA: L-glutamate gamma-semialdehyde dehydrogenase [Chloroflexota bacterium]|nr:L-glutamate gamma-semialdehyde dehydrogenase [Chloroflexota bacterium]